MRLYPQKLRIVHLMNPLPMHDQAQPAAEAAMAAHAQGKYWEMENAIFDHQRELGPERYVEIARQIGLDVPRFQRDLASHAWQASIQTQQEMAGRLGARGTPMFFLNGRKMPGAAPLERFRAKVDEEIARAERAIREDHVPPAGIYEHLTRDGADSIQGVRSGRAAAPLPGHTPVLAQPRPDLGSVQDVAPTRSERGENQGRGKKEGNGTQ